MFVWMPSKRLDNDLKKGDNILESIYNTLHEWIDL